MESSRKIKIFFENEQENVLVQGNKLSKSTILDTFQVSKGKLTCSLGGEEFLLTTDEQNYMLDAHVNEYTLTSMEGIYYNDV